MFLRFAYLILNVFLLAIIVFLIVAFIDSGINREEAFPLMFFLLIAIVLIIFCVNSVRNIFEYAKEERTIKKQIQNNHYGSVSRAEVKLSNSKVTIAGYDYIIVAEAGGGRGFETYAPENSKRFNRLFFWCKMSQCFDKNTDYETVLGLVKKMKFRIVNCIDEVPQKLLFTNTQNSNAKFVENKKEKSSINPVDVNNCSEEELCNLPGVNKITAKRIIKKRESDGGFESVEDFIKYIKPTSSIEAQLRERICALEIKDKQIKKNNEREVDI